MASFVDASYLVFLRRNFFTRSILLLYFRHGSSFTAFAGRIRLLSDRELACGSRDINTLEASVGSRAGETYIGPKKGESIPNRGQRRVRLRLGEEAGPAVAMCIQDASVRRPILAVSESTDAGNLIVFDKAESVILPKGSPEIEAIRQLVSKAQRKLAMRRQKGIFTLDAWVEPPRPFAR